MVTSVSWPTPEIVGMREAASARARRSSLNGARSSGEPPPRARMRTSKPPRRFKWASAAAISAAAISPWTRTG